MTLDLATPRDHDRYRRALATPPDARTPVQRQHIEWMEGRSTEPCPRQYTPTALGDR